MKETSLVMLKPYTVLRRLSGKIIRKFEEKGLKIVAIKMIIIERDDAEKLYAEHEAKPIFNDLMDYMISSPVLLMVIEGDDCISLIRKMIGATNPREAELGTIRSAYSHAGRNTIHASDSPESAEREIKLFFNDSEICKYSIPDEEFIYKL